LQSILRQANFKGAKLIGASFFDADLTGLANTKCYNNECKMHIRMPFTIYIHSLPICFLLSGADLSDADLRNADFSLANVTKVIVFLY